VAAVLTLGYKASAEQFPPADLLEFARAAERHGFDSVAVSDHFQPFRHTGGHAVAALPWLGAFAAASSRIRIGTSVLTPTLRYHPSVVAQAFATLAGFAPGRVFLGAGTGEAMNDVPALALEWPGFRERLDRLAEAIELIRALWAGERVDFDGRFYRTRRATVYDRPEQPPPILVAAAGKRTAEFAGSAGDGFITTGGKPRALYAETLLPAVDSGLAAAGRDPAAYERLIEVKVSYERDRERAIADCRFWAPLALPAEAKQGVEDPVELERLADDPAVRPETRFIVSGDPQEQAERISEYVELGFRHLVFHSPAADQLRFVERFGAEVLPLLRDRHG
jgi:coenzyme F420-dependent glucose-6-phosphate dehydrogenase